MVANRKGGVRVEFGKMIIILDATQTPLMQVKSLEGIGGKQPRVLKCI
jgi:hypothetical protein